MLAYDDIAPLFRQRPYRSARAPAVQWAWREDDELDIEYHVRHSALPEPGRVRELLALGSRLHGSLLDRQRPLWEFHLIEGLEGNRFAAYTKVHHAMVDGVSALRLLERWLSTDPTAEVPPAWAARPKRPRPEAAGGSPLDLLLDPAKGAADIVGVAPTMLRSARRAMQEDLAAFPFKAPPTMLQRAHHRCPAHRRPDVEPGPGEGRRQGVRRHAQRHRAGHVLGRAAPVPRRAGRAARGVAHRHGPGVAAHRRQRRRQRGRRGRSPRWPPTPRTPAGGWPASASRCRSPRTPCSGLSPLQVLALSAANMFATPLVSMLGGGEGMRPPFNIIISNVPGPRKDLYLNGARLQGVYPVSIPYHGQALNITLTSYVDNLEIGLTGLPPPGPAPAAAPRPPRGVPRGARGRRRPQQRPPPKDPRFRDV